MPFKPNVPPMRRRDDNTSNVGEWTVLTLALLGFALTFCIDMATYESFAEMLTPKFIGLHAGQLLTVLISVVAAKRIK